MGTFYLVKKFVIVSALLLTLPGAAKADFSRNEKHRDFGWHGPRHCDGESREEADGRWSHHSHSYQPNWPRYEYTYPRYSYPRYSNSGSFGELRYDDSRFHEGIRNGDLSRNEIAEIRDKRQDYVSDKVRFESDGWLSQREAQHLREDLRDYHKSLNHELNDGEYRRRGYFR